MAARSRALLAGAALILPALVLLVVAYVEPALWTLRASLKQQDIIPIGESGSESQGASFANYRDLGAGGFTLDLAAALAYSLVPILVVLVAAPLLAWTADRSGTAGRWVTRGVLVLPLALYAPSALIAARILDYGFTMRSHYWWGTFGLVAALATTLYLAALRRRDPKRTPWPALAVSAGIALAAVLAAALQEFSYSLAGLDRGHGPPLSRLWLEATERFEFGPAVAGSSVVLLLVMLLGLAVTAAIVLSGLRLEYDGPRGSAGPHPASLIAGGAVLVAVLALTVYGLNPLLRHYFDDEASADTGAPILVNTWVPPLLTALVGVVIAAAAAVGIAWVRPLGRHSEWLLAPFGLFLFVGLGPLAVRHYARYTDADMTFFRLVPPWWVCVPALFVLTVFVRGQARRGSLLPVVPMAVLAFLVSWVVQAQDLGWQFVANPVAAEKYLTGPVAVFRSAAFAVVPVRLALPIGALLLLLLGAAAAQLLYLDRIALRVGRTDALAGPIERSAGPPEGD